MRNICQASSSVKAHHRESEIGNRESGMGIGNRESGIGIGNRESGIGNRESGIGTGNRDTNRGSTSWTDADPLFRRSVSYNRYPLLTPLPLSQLEVVLTHEIDVGRIPSSRDL